MLIADCFALLLTSNGNPVKVVHGSIWIIIVLRVIELAVYFIRMIHTYNALYGIGNYTYKICVLVYYVFA